MILYAALAAFLTGLAFGGYGVSEWDGYQQDKKDKAQAEAQAELEARVKTAETEAKGWIDAAAGAYVDGETKGRETAVRVSGTTRQIVAAGAGFQNPACTAGPDGLGLYAAALRGIRSGTVAETPVGTPAAAQATTVAPAPAIAAPAPVPAAAAPPASGRPPKPKPMTK